MFTGIIECLGTIHQIHNEGTNKSFWIGSSLLHELKVDQSIAHDGVCLTIEVIENNTHKVTAVVETLRKTTLGSWKKGDRINLERCLQADGRLDGHFVQGHIDSRGIILEKKDMNGSWEFTIEFPKEFAALIIEKGSISINGISLTAFNVTTNQLKVAIIPYTYALTNLSFLNKGDLINLEFDLLGKYIVRWQETKL
jgi:riboflavin synthase